MTLDSMMVAIGGDGGTSAELRTLVMDIAEPTGATVSLVHVFSPEEYEDATERLDFDSSTDSTPDRVARRYTDLGELSKGLDDHGIEYTVRGFVNENVSDELISVAEDEDADLVIIGGRKRTPVGKAIFGSTAQSVTLNAPCPVVIVQEP